MRQYRAIVVQEDQLRDIEHLFARVEFAHQVVEIGYATLGNMLGNRYAEGMQQGSGTLCSQNMFRLTLDTRQQSEADNKGQSQAQRNGQQKPRPKSHAFLSSPLPLEVHFREREGMISVR